MLASFLIFLREGIEGSLILSIMCTYLAAAGRRDLFRWVFAGAGAAVLTAIATAVALYIFVKDAFINSLAQTWFETGTFLLAVVVLTYMTFWMKRHARSMSTALKDQMAAALGGSAVALTLVAFATVGREAVETAILVLAIAFRNSTSVLLVGAALGLTCAMALSVVLYRTGLKMNMKRVFTIVGAALLVVAAGLLADAIQNLQDLQVLPGRGQAVWHTEGLIANDSILGDILHGILGYAASPTMLQIAAWSLFLAIGLTAFLDGRVRVRRVVAFGPRRDSDQEANVS